MNVQIGGTVEGSLSSSRRVATTWVSQSESAQCFLLRWVSPLCVYTLFFCIGARLLPHPQIPHRNLWCGVCPE